MESIIVPKIHKIYEKLTRKDVFYSLYHANAFHEVNHQEIRPLDIVTYNDNEGELHE